MKVFIFIKIYFLQYKSSQLSRHLYEFSKLIETSLTERTIKLSTYNATTRILILNNLDFKKSYLGLEREGVHQQPYLSPDFLSRQLGVQTAQLHPHSENFLQPTSD